MYDAFKIYFLIKNYQNNIFYIFYINTIKLSKNY